PDPAPELPPAPASVPKPAPVSAPTVAVPPALLDHAQKVADTHHATTGDRIDSATLRARLNVPAPLADAITAQLA
ncbi:SpdA protein, partial [Streptomyces sp. FT05W]